MERAHISPHGIEGNATNNQLVASLKRLHPESNGKSCQSGKKAFLSISQPLGLNSLRRLQ